MRLCALLVFGLLALWLIHPVNASPLDDGVEMVAKGIERYLELRAEKNLEKNFGVSFGNNSDMENYTAGQKIVYMIAAAEQNPLQLQWVRDSISSEFVYYYSFALLILFFTYLLEILQKMFPEKISGAFQAFTGHEGAIDYSVLFETTAILAMLPVFIFPILEFFRTLEQVFTDSLMTDSMEYISFASQDAGVGFFESITYTICAPFFAFRIQYINEFYAHVFIVILLLALVFRFSKMIGLLFCAWYLSALFVRPVVLFYSSLAVKDVASKSGMEAVLATQANMSLVLILSFITVLVAVLWPVLILILKIITDYITYAVFKANRITKLVRSK